MKFGQQVKWMNGNNWHMGTVIASYGNNTFGVTHVLNPTQATSVDQKVKVQGNQLVAINDSGIGYAKYAYTRPNLRQVSTNIPVGQESIGIGQIVYTEQFKKQAGIKR